jgi:dodecin
MSIARVTEISATSPNSFDDAVKQGIERANQSLRNVQSAWVKEQTVKVTNGKVENYRVNMMITFVLDD